MPDVFYSVRFSTHDDAYQLEDLLDRTLSKQEAVLAAYAHMYTNRHPYYCDICYYTIYEHCMESDQVIETHNAEEFMVDYGIDPPAVNVGCYISMPSWLQTNRTKQSCVVSSIRFERGQSYFMLKELTARGVSISPIRWHYVRIEYAHKLNPFQEWKITASDPARWEHLPV